MFFSTGGVFSLRPRTADLGAARLGRQGIDRGPVGREPRPRPRPRPVARAARSQSRKNRVSFAGSPSVSAVPSRRRETRSATAILEKMVQPIPYIYPMNSDLLYDSSRNIPHVDLTRGSHPSMCTHHAAGSTHGGCRCVTTHRVAVSYEFISSDCARLVGRYRSFAASLSSCISVARCQMGGS